LGGGGGEGGKKGAIKHAFKRSNRGFYAASAKNKGERERGMGSEKYRIAGTKPETNGA